MLLDDITDWYYWLTESLHGGIIRVSPFVLHSFFLFNAPRSICGTFHLVHHPCFITGHLWFWGVEEAQKMRWYNCSSGPSMVWRRYVCGRQQCRHCCCTRYVYSGNGHYSAHCHTGWLTHLCQAAYCTGTNYSGKPALWRVHDYATVGQPALTIAGHRHCFNRHYRERSLLRHCLGTKANVD